MNQTGNKSQFYELQLLNATFVVCSSAEIKFQGNEEFWKSFIFKSAWPKIYKTMNDSVIDLTIDHLFRYKQDLTFP